MIIYITIGVRNLIQVHSKNWPKSKFSLFWYFNVLYTDENILKWYKLCVYCNLSIENILEKCIVVNT